MPGIGARRRRIVGSALKHIGVGWCTRGNTRLGRHGAGPRLVELSASGRVCFLLRRGASGLERAPHGPGRPRAGGGGCLYGVAPLRECHGAPRLPCSRRRGLAVPEKPGASSTSSVTVIAGRRFGRRHRSGGALPGSALAHCTPVRAGRAWPEPEGTQQRWESARRARALTRWGCTSTAAAGRLLPAVRGRAASCGLAWTRRPPGVGRKGGYP